MRAKLAKSGGDPQSSMRSTREAIRKPVTTSCEQQQTYPNGLLQGAQARQKIGVPGTAANDCAAQATDDRMPAKSSRCSSAKRVVVAYGGAHAALGIHCRTCMRCFRARSIIASARDRFAAVDGTRGGSIELGGSWTQGFSEARTLVVCQRELCMRNPMGLRAGDGLPCSRQFCISRSRRVLEAILDKLTADFVPVEASSEDGGDRHSVFCACAVC